MLGYAAVNKPPDLSDFHTKMYFAHIESTARPMVLQRNSLPSGDPGSQYASILRFYDLNTWLLGSLSWREREPKSHEGVVDTSASK